MARGIYSHSGTRGGRTEPERNRHSRESTLPLSELIARKRESILFAQTELHKAEEIGNKLHIESAEMILRAMQNGLATLERMQAEETERC